MNERKIFKRKHTQTEPSLKKHENCAKMEKEKRKILGRGIGVVDRGNLILASMKEVIKNKQLLYNEHKKCLY